MQQLHQLGAENQTAIDRFTAGHAAVGLLLRLGRLPWWAALAIAVGWEVIETPIKNAMPRAFPFPTADSFANAATDVVAVMTGYGLGRLLDQGQVDLWFTDL